MKRNLFYVFTAALLGGCMIVSDAQVQLDKVDARYENIESLNVEGVFCDVTIEPGNSDEVHLTGEIRGTRSSDDYSIQTSQEGGDLKVWIEHPQNMYGNIKGFLILQVPENVSLSVNNVSGNVKVDNIHSDNILLKNISGNIDVSDAGKNGRLQSVSGNINASVMNGSLTVKSVSGRQQISNIKGDLSSRSTSGSISLKMIEGMVDVGTTSGDLVFDNLMDGVSAKSTSGDIKINVASGNLSLKSISGNISLSDVTGKADVKTISGDQKGNMIMLTDQSSFSSISGGITMDLSNQIEALNFDLKSKSGKLTVGETRADDRLVINGGGIIVKGSSTSGNQIFR